MKVVIVCHVENDLNNKFGQALNLPVSQQSFAHCPKLLDWLRGFNIPITLGMMVGGQAENRLLEALRGNKDLLSLNFEKAIHYHAEKYLGNSWQYKLPLVKEAYERYYKSFQANFQGVVPRSVVFGKWMVDQNAFIGLSALGIKVDGSIISPDLVLSSPKYIGKILSVPVASWQGRPINPLTRFSDYYIIRKLIKHYHHKNFILHLSFHSYDLFNFIPQPEWRQGKQARLNHLIKLVKKYHLATIFLKDISLDNYENLDNFRIPLLANLSQKLNH